MRLATFVAENAAPAVGWVAADRIVDLQAAHLARFGVGYDGFADMLALIAAGAEGLARVGDLIAGGAAAQGRRLDAVRLLAPVPVPPQIRDFSVFERHIRDAPVGGARMRARLFGEPMPPADAPPPPIAPVYRQQPIYYHSNRFSVVGPDADIAWPSYCEFLDFELEIGMFIGRGGRDIPRDQAHRHIFGYTLFNDFSARDQQAREMLGRLGPAKGKSFDTGNAVGPWIVTADEIPDIRALGATVRVNGEIWAQSTTADMLHDFDDMIAFTSRDETLHAGELFGSGTVGGCCGLEMDRWLADGDVVALEIPEIGVLRNRVVRRPRG